MQWTEARFYIGFILPREELEEFTWENGAAQVNPREILLTNCMTNGVSA